MADKEQDENVVMVVPAPVSNYYGTVTLFVHVDGTGNLDLENWDGWGDGRAVSKEFVTAWINEFGAK